MKVKNNLQKKNGLYIIIFSIGLIYVSLLEPFATVPVFQKLNFFNKIKAIKYIRNELKSTKHKQKCI